MLPYASEITDSHLSPDIHEEIQDNVMISYLSVSTEHSHMTLSLELFEEAQVIGDISSMMRFAPVFERWCSSVVLLIKI